MAKNTVNNIRLGVFVLAGLLFLILLLYMIGKNKNLFGSTFLIKARFENVQELMSGNNVRYAGIEIGTVKKIEILNDTLIEVTMLVSDKMKQVIHNNAIASIGTDGLMGNKLINITPSREPAALINEGGTLVTRKSVDTDEMFRTLGETNNDIAIIVQDIKTTVSRINTSTALWKILNDTTLPQNLRASTANARLATERTAEITKDIQLIINDIKAGKGSLGEIIRDTSFVRNLTETVDKLKMAGNRIDDLVSDFQNEINNGNGPVNALLKDSSMVIKLNNTLNNIEKGTDAFNQNMEALKHNFLLRGYFRKLEKQK